MIDCLNGVINDWIKSRIDWKLHCKQSQWNCSSINAMPFELQWTMACIETLQSAEVDTVRPATALFLVPGIYSAIENSANWGSCYLVLCKFLQKIVL